MKRKSQTTKSGSKEENHGLTESDIEEESEDAHASETRESFLDFRSKRVLVREMKYRKEKEMKDIQRDTREMKRRKTLQRASQPRSKQSTGKSNKKQNGTIRLARGSVEELHEELSTSLEGDLLEIYLCNYRYWLMKKEQAMMQAEEMDKEAEIIHDAQAMKRKEKSEIDKHRLLFQDTLQAIATVVPHTNKSQQKKTTTSKLSMFFKPKVGVYKQRVENEFNRFYFEEVSTQVDEISSWPDIQHLLDLHKDPERYTQKTKIKQLENMICSECETNSLVIDHKMGCYVCTTCGLSFSEGDGVKYGESFDQIQSSSRGAAPYDRLAHVSIFVIS